MNQQNKNCINKNALLDTTVSNVFVVKNSKKRAFIEEFNYSSINFTQKNLGNILGFFVVRDESPTSENIVNFLASEVKKKYFAPNQKTIEEKFELTLHHVNRALEEIANIGNIDWLGHVEGVVCVIDDVSMHFSVTGDAHILLLRDNNLIDISEGLASEDAQDHPLKTFVDISSGELCVDDKIIITSKELLELIPFEELQKNAIRFGQKNFIQFLETALTNECDIATTTIIDIGQKNIPDTYIEKESAPIPTNAFGADAFETEEPPENTPDSLESSYDETDDTYIDVDAILSEDLPDDEYTDPRTGHIHIQGTDTPIEDPTLTDTLKETFDDKLDSTKIFLSKQFKSISKKVTSFKAKPEPNIEAENELDIIAEQTIDDVFDDTQTMKEKTTETTSKKKTPSLKQPKEHSIFEDDITNATQKDISQTFPQKTKIAVYKICSTTKDAAKNTTTTCVSMITRFKSNQHQTEQLHDPIDTNESIAQKKTILPRIRHITNLWREMDTRHKLIALGILAFMIIVPIVFSMFSSSDTEPAVETPSQEEPSPVTEDLTEPTPTKNESTISDPTEILSDNLVVSTLFMNDRQISVLKDKLTLFNDSHKDSYKIPSDAGDIKFATNMDDLDLAFLLTSKNKLYSFSPTTTKFVEQKNIPKLDATTIHTLNSYLTYIYTTDDNMINRYARTENGFADPENWLNDEIDLSQTTSLAIDDDIYTTNTGEILKFAKHNKISFSQDSDIEKAYLVYTTPDTKNMWILDKENKTLFKTKKGSGKKIKEYSHENFEQATSLIVDEKNNTAIISTPNKILSFKL